MSYSSRSMKTVKFIQMESFAIAMVLASFIVYSGALLGQQQNINIDLTVDLCKGGDSCGPNGICQNMDGSIQCSCPPGFNFVDDAIHSKGCFRSSFQQSCKQKSEMQDIGNTDWPGNDYESIPYISQTACKQVCLVDCFCIIAVHGVNEAGIPTCWKKAMPVMKGFTGAERATFVKISEPSKEKKWWVDVAIGSTLLGCSFLLAIFSVIVYKQSRTFQRGAEATQKTSNATSSDVEDAGNVEMSNVTGIDVRDAVNVKTSNVKDPRGTAATQKTTNVARIGINDAGNVKDLHGNGNQVRAGIFNFGGVSRTPAA